MDVREIGRQLNADTVVEGGLRRDGERLRITVQLIDAETGYHLWSERFERTLDSVFTLEDEIATAIASRQTAQLVAGSGLAKAFTSDQQAFALALGGHAMALGLMGHVADAYAVAETMTPEFILSNPLFLGATGATLAAGGRVEEAQAMLQALTDDARFPRKSCYSIAWVYLGLGEIDEAFRWLARGVEERDPKFVFLRNKPFWDPLRADPRFDGLLRRMNLI